MQRVSSIRIIIFLLTQGKDPATELLYLGEMRIMNFDPDGQQNQSFLIKKETKQNKNNNNKKKQKITKNNS